MPKKGNDSAGDGAPREVSEAESAFVEEFLTGRRDEARFVGTFLIQLKKKHDPRLIVVGKFKVYLFIPQKKGAPKPGREGNIIELKQIKSEREDKFSLEFKTFTVTGSACDATSLVTALRQAYETLFSSFGNKLKPKIEVEESRLKPVEKPSKAALDSSSGGFSGVYEALCDLYSMKARLDVMWDMDNLLPANNVREFSLHEIEKPYSSTDLKPIIGALNFNPYFTKFNASNFSLNKELMSYIAGMVGHNKKIEELLMANAGVGAEFLAVAEALGKNKKNSVTLIDWSNNKIGNKTLVTLGKAIGDMGHGLGSLKLAQCGGDKKGMSAFFSSIKSNAHSFSTLARLDISGNRLDAEGSSSLAAYLANPGVLEELNVRNTGASLEPIFSAITRGCPELQVLDISSNKIVPKADGPAIKKFVGAASKLQEFRLSETAVPVQVLRNMMKTLSGNAYVRDVRLHIDGNKLGSLGANMVAGLVPDAKNIAHLDLSNNDFGDEGFTILCDGLANSPSLTSVDLSDNLSSKKTKGRGSAIESLIQLMTSESPLKHLIFSASPSFKLGLDLLPVILTLGSVELESIDVRGHGFGDKGGVALGKALQTNRSIKKLLWDDNNVGEIGFRAFASGLQRNPTLVDVPTPWNDISAVMRGSADVRTILSEIERALARNQSPKSKLATMQGMSKANLNIMVAGDREEIDSLRFKIKAATANKSPSEDQERIIADAEAHDAHLGVLLGMEEDLREALEAELRSSLAGSVSSIMPVIDNAHNELADRIVSAVGKSYLSFGPEFTKALNSTLHNPDGRITKEKIIQMIISETAPRITEAASESMINIIETATGMLFEDLFDRLEDVLESLKEGEKAKPSKKADDPPGKKLPPTPPSKGSKPKKEKKAGSGGGGASADVATALAGKESSATPLKHATRDRPIGPRKRRPQRRPQRRPMMEGETS